MSLPLSIRGLGVALSAVAFALVACAGHAVADTVYVVGGATGQLIRFDIADPVGTRVDVLPAGSVYAATSLAMGPDGRLYIGQGGKGPSVSRLDLATNALGLVADLSGAGTSPGSLAFRGDDLFIGRDPRFGGGGAVLRLANATGAPGAIDDFTVGGNLSSAAGLAFGADGSLFVSDQAYDFASGLASGTVKRFDASGSYLGEFLGDPAGAGLFGPAGLAISGDALFTASLMSGTILRTDLATGLTTTFASTGVAFEASTLAVLSDGGVLVGGSSVGSLAGNLYHFDASGALVGTYATGLGAIGGLVVVPAPGALGLAVVFGFGAARRRRREGLTGPSNRASRSRAARSRIRSDRRSVAIDRRPGSA